ncbi:MULTISPECIES: KEOPS complex subunit Pcc1 [Methanobacterium]|jgi:KEOPS complex subunit Pcc1|uniref:KEOPS complex subunit Pcc1 n=1 Tax=Methanobacterium veterum TaxID=408577 RepID=A0A9E4ZT06_9EURY|nr:MULTISPECIES: KEOPS complex subunit Pcc1 [Methanobacterium]MCZ3364594.1 KEOPS complex subunit Pcc1 [Methanobacterium veterum]MCZ3372348.1 KEOPS complex subunit Pcc1 [Methanobacterium veterum]
MNIPEHVKAEFKIKFNNLDEAKLVLKSIEPEIQTAPSEKTSVEINLDGKTLKLIIDAEDTPSLRASVNSYFRWITLSHEVNSLKDTE